jgi:hypothetical protein
MKKPFSLLAALVIILASCSKSTIDPAPIVDNNMITLNPSADIVTVGPNSYWRSLVQVSSVMSDSSFVKVQYDIYNASNAIQYSVVDTIKIAPYVGGTPGHITNNITSLNWTAKNVHIVKAWCKNGIYTFSY